MIGRLVRSSHHRIKRLTQLTIITHLSHLSEGAPALRTHISETLGQLLALKAGSLAAAFRGEL